MDKRWVLALKGDVLSHIDPHPIERNDNEWAEVLDRKLAPFWGEEESCTYAELMTNFHLEVLTLKLFMIVSSFSDT